MRRDSHYWAGEGSFMEQQVFLHVVGISDTDCQLWEPWAKPQASHQAKLLLMLTGKCLNVSYMLSTDNYS